MSKRTINIDVNIYFYGKGNESRCSILCPFYRYGQYWCDLFQEKLAIYEPDDEFSLRCMKCRNKTRRR